LFENQDINWSDHMPIEVGIWKIEDEIKKLSYSPIESEKKLEDILEKEIHHHIL
jgi:hypothetical protein